MNRLFLVSLVLLWGCQPDLTPEFVTEANGLEIVATISKIEFDFGEDQAALYADLIVSNTTETAARYSNSWLWLESRDGLKVRANLDSVASNQIDFSEVKIDSNEVLKLKVYWVFPGDKFEQESEYPFELTFIPGR